MTITIAPWTDAELPLVQRLVDEPALASEFDLLRGEALDRVLSDPFCRPETRLVAFDGDTPAGFAFAFVLPGAAHAPWAMLRVGVAEAHRRLGIGARLFDAARARISSVAPDTRELCSSAWEPCPAAEAFAEARGMTLVRNYWLMRRDDTERPAPEWPAGIEPRAFEVCDTAIADYTDAYNQAFAQHYHFVPATPDDIRGRVSRPAFDPRNVMLVYAGARCVGFCVCERMPDRGEVDIVGVTPEARGRGLGRALLRWGGRRLVEMEALPITLLVDGENERALELYRSEGYAVVRTRRIWARAF